MGQQGAGNGQALLLAARKARAGLPHQGLVPLGQRGNKVVGLGRLGGRFHLFAGGIRLAQRQVGPNRVVKQKRVLAHQSKQGAHPGLGEVPHVHSVHRHRPAFGVQKPRKQIEQRRLSSAAGAYQRHRLSLFHRGRKFLNSRAFGLRIPNGNAVPGQFVGEGQRSIGLRRRTRGKGRIGQGVGPVQHFKDAFGSRVAALDGVKGVGQGFESRNQLVKKEDIAHERRTA